MKSRLATICCLVALLTPTLATAVDSSGNYAVWGLGKKSCFAFSKNVSEGNIDNYRDYFKGFLTAYNIFTEKTYSISGRMDENQIIEWISTYCEENQMSSVENALVSFTFDHYDNRMKSSMSTGR